MGRRWPGIVVLGLALTVAAGVPAIGSTQTTANQVAIVATQPTPIQHVVVIDLENHSFDNVFGFWCNANPSRCPDGGMPATVTLSDGSTVTPSVSPDTVPNVLHSVAAQQAAMDVQNGVPLMDGWQNIPDGSCAASTNYRCVSGYLPTQIPNQVSLADQFAISDATFSMGNSPSWGGHLYAVMGSLDGFTGDNPTPAKGVTAGPGWGCDSKRVTNWVSPYTGQLYSGVPSCVPDSALGIANGGAFKKTPVQDHVTILDELTRAQLSWKIYGALNPTDGGYIWSVCPSIADCHDTTQSANLVEASQFVTDAQSGNLPAFSLVVAGGAGNLTKESCHNAFSMTACDNYIAQLVSAVQGGADWSSSAIFITYDDCGCFYDQVAPPAGLNADGTQAGPRVPLMIVSPFAQPGYTDTTPTTYAGILAYTEQTFGLAALSQNDAHAYPFADAFNYNQTPLKPSRLRQTPLPASARKIKASAAGSDPS
jgi:phospholipase C